MVTREQLPEFPKQGPEGAMGPRDEFVLFRTRHGRVERIVLLFAIRFGVP